MDGRLGTHQICVVLRYARTHAYLVVASDVCYTTKYGLSDLGVVNFEFFSLLLVHSIHPFLSATNGKLSFVFLSLQLQWLIACLPVIHIIILVCVFIYF